MGFWTLILETASPMLPCPCEGRLEFQPRRAASKAGYGRVRASAGIGTYPQASTTFWPASDSIQSM